MKKLLPIICLFFGIQAHAGIYAEPYLGYTSSTMNTTAKATGTKSTSSGTGFGYGARLGYHFGQLWLAGEYMGGTGKDKEGSVESDITTTSLGAALGYDFGQFGIWGGYGFSETVVIKTPGSSDTTITGSNFKFGAGYRVIDYLSLNLEYIISSYSKAKLGSLPEVDLDTLYSKFEISTIMFSVSFPLGASSKK